MWNLYFNTSNCKVLHIPKRPNPNHDYTAMDVAGKAGNSIFMDTKYKDEEDQRVTFNNGRNFDIRVQNKKR